MPARGKWSQFAIVLGRALLVSSFVEDAVRHGWEWSEDLNWVHARLHIGDKYLPWFACAVLLALEIGLQLAGSLLASSQAHWFVLALPPGCVPRHHQQTWSKVQLPWTQASPLL